MEAEGTALEKRVRKATTFFKAPAATTKKELATGEGSGIPLGENPHFCKDLESIKSDNEVCKALHSVMYNSVGKKVDMKKNLRAFSGFATSEDLEEKKSKVLEKKKIWTVTMLKTALGMFGVEKSGDREALVGRMIDYLAEPRFTKDAATAGKKRKSTGPASSKKGSKKTRKVKDKDRKKRAPSGYILFCKDQRATLREEQPDLSMVDQTRALGALWNALDDKTKESWNEKAKQLKAAMVGEEDAAGSDGGNDNDDDEEEDEEEKEETGEGAELTGDIDFGSDEEAQAEDDFKDLED